MATITYLIFAHNNAQFLYNLILQLNYPNCNFYIHIDKKSQEDFSLIQNIPNVRFSSQKTDIGWGDISMINALILCCQEIVSLNLGDTIVFLSGQDFPIKSNEYIYQYLSSRVNENFIIGTPILSPACNWEEHGRRRIECYALRVANRKIATIEPHKLTLANIKQIFKVALYSPKKISKALDIYFKYPIRQHPIGLQPYAGEFWWILPVKSIKTVLSYISSHPEFIEYHKNTSIPDEIVFNTLIYNLIPKEYTNNTCLRYIKWRNSPSPDNVTIEDQDIIKECLNNPNILFIRKIDSIKTCNFIKELISEH